MKNIILVLSLFSLVLTVTAKDGTSVSSTDKTETLKPINKDEIVVNNAMIERFNSVEYTDDQVSFMDLVEHKTFNEVRTIAQAYKNGEIDMLTETSIAEYENLVDDNELILLSETNLHKDIE